MSNEKDKQNKQNEEIKHYSVFWHRAVLIAYLILIFCISTVVIPWILKLVYSLFSTWEGFSGELAAGDSSEYLMLLPDFFGGLFGILIATLLDSIIVARLIHLKRYDALTSVLWAELDEIRSMTEKIGSIDGVMPGDTLPTPILDGIIGSHESMSIIHNLPRYFFWEKRVALSKVICDLATDIANLNVYLSATMRNAETVSNIIVNARDEYGMNQHTTIKTLKREYKCALIFFAKCCSYELEDCTIDDIQGPNYIGIKKDDAAVLEYLGKKISEEKCDIKSRIDKIERILKAKKD